MGYRGEPARRRWRAPEDVRLAEIPKISNGDIFFGRPCLNNLPPNNMWFPSNTYAQDFNEEYRGKRRKSKRSPKKRSKSRSKSPRRSKSRSKGKKRSHRRR